MSDQYLTTILGIGLAVVSVAFLVAIFLLIYSFLQIKKASMALTEFLASTELKINPVLKEAEETLKSIKTVCDDIGSATSNIRSISGVLSDIALQARTLGILTEDLQNRMNVRLAGLKAGMKAALSVLLDQKTKGEE